MGWNSCPSIPNVGVFSNSPTNSHCRQSLTWGRLLWLNRPNIKMWSIADHFFECVKSLSSQLVHTAAIETKCIASHHFLSCTFNGTGNNYFPTFIVCFLWAFPVCHHVGSFVTLDLDGIYIKCPCVWWWVGGFPYTLELYSQINTQTFGSQLAQLTVPFSPVMEALRMGAASKWNIMGTHNWQCLQHHNPSETTVTRCIFIHTDHSTYIIFF